MRGENQSTRGKTSHSRVENQQTQSTFDAESGNRTQATLVEGKCYHHWCSSKILTWSCSARNINLDEVGEEDAYREIIKTKELERQTSPARFCENSTSVATLLLPSGVVLDWLSILSWRRRGNLNHYYLRFCLIFQKIEETNEITGRISQNFLILLELSVLPFENGVHELYKLLKLWNIKKGTRDVQKNNAASLIA